MRRIVRFLIGPLARYAAEGTTFNVYSVRGSDGAFLCYIDCFGAVHQKHMGYLAARSLADDLLDDAYNAAEGMPLPPS